MPKAGQWWWYQPIGLSFGSHVRNLHSFLHVSSLGLQQEALGLQVQIRSRSVIVRIRNNNHGKDS
ncbi:2012_t:CDS:2 [Diversispora eburnea]|uniref:2012_t:CDS:1 n=1 Tax=Diversispora eburnea TaxID=1213867 RepID=A0A9N9FQY1_9GLOM|nr:2012_t:CDS:2 [Diversispora eburnea]